MTTYTECPTTGFKIPKDEITHELKIWPQYYRAVKDGSKTFEVRNNDRGFQKGDFVRLREWDPSKERFLGDSLTFRIGYVLPIDAERVVFSLIKEESL